MCLLKSEGRFICCFSVKGGYAPQMRQTCPGLSGPQVYPSVGAGGEGDDRGWDGWVASLTRWTWIWVNSGSWWWTGRPGVLRFMGLQRVGHDWATELNWTDGSSVFNFLRNVYSVSIVAEPVYIAINSAHGFPFLDILTYTRYLLSFW